MISYKLDRMMAPNVKTMQILIYGLQNIEIDELVDFCGDYGKVYKAELMFDNKKELNGYAKVIMESKGAQDLCLAFDNMPVKGCFLQYQCK